MIETTLAGMNSAFSVDINVTLKSQKKRTVMVRKVFTNILAR